MKKRKPESGEIVCGKCPIFVPIFCTYYREILTFSHGKGSCVRTDKCRKEFPGGVMWTPSETVKKERKPK